MGEPEASSRPGADLRLRLIFGKTAFYKLTLSYLFGVGVVEEWADAVGVGVF